MTNQHWRWLGAMALWMVAASFAESARAQGASLSSSRPAPDTTLATRCQALVGSDFSNIVEAPTEVLAAKVVEARGESPTHCQVSGYVTPNVGFLLYLPPEWNGKFMQLGCGGHCGSIPAFDSPVDGAYSCAPPLRKAYACLVSDMGHKGVMTDGLWGYRNLEAKFDWGLRSTHVAAVAGKALTDHFYTKAPRKSYFMGCSTGGRQALQEAQRFPWDFDGIIAGSPPVNLSLIYLTFAWGMRATHDAAGKPLMGEEELKLLTAAAVAKCDLDDGAKDGVIGDPVRCAFDPAELACKAGQGRGCLTALQIEAVKKVYAGPMTSRGEKLWLGGPLPGSEYTQEGFDWREAYRVHGKPTAHTTIAVEGFRYLFFMPEPGPTWTLSDLDFDRDYKRLSLMQAVYDSRNPDLRQFKAAGGKLIIYQNMNDISVLPRATIDYYETVERTMGGRAATLDFARLFLLPGTSHCGRGDGAWVADWLGHLEAWVEKGQAPEKVLSARVRLEDPRQNNSATSSAANVAKRRPRLEFPLDPAIVEFTRPVYPYPTRAKYSGRGDVKDGANWGPAVPR